MDHSTKTDIKTININRKYFEYTIQPPNALKFIQNRKRNGTAIRTKRYNKSTETHIRKY